MKTSLKWRIIGSLLVGGINFILLCVLYKFLIIREDWLLYSIAWALAWGSGYFVGSTIISKKEKLIKVIAIEGIVIVAAFVVAFLVGGLVFGGVIRIATWSRYTIAIAVSFGTSIIVNSLLFKR